MASVCKHCKRSKLTPRAYKAPNLLTKHQQVNYYELLHICLLASWKDITTLQQTLSRYTMITFRPERGHTNFLIFSSAMRTGIIPYVDQESKKGSVHELTPCRTLFALSFSIAGRNRRNFLHMRAHLGSEGTILIPKSSLSLMPTNLCHG